MIESEGRNQKGLLRRKRKRESSETRYALYFFLAAVAFLAGALAVDLAVMENGCVSGTIVWVDVLRSPYRQ